MSTASEMYSLYLEAEKKILKGKVVRFGERQLTREDLPEVIKGRQEWELKMKSEAAGGNKHSLASFD